MKTLLCEINRNRVLMNLPILKESLNPALWIDLAKTVTKTIEDNPKLLGVGTDEVSRIINDLKVLKNDDEILLKLSRLSELVPAVNKTITEAVLSTLTKVEKESINTMANFIIKTIAENNKKSSEVASTVSYWVERNIKTDYKGAKNVIVNDMLDQIKIHYDLSGTFPKKIEVKKINPTINPKGAQVVSSIEKWSKAWNSLLKNSDLNKAEILSVNKKFPLRKSRAHLQFMFESFTNKKIKNIDASIEEMMGKLKKFTESIETGKVDTSIISDINITLQSFKKNELDDINIFREYIIDGMRNNKIDSGIIQKVKDYLYKENPLDPKAPSWFSEWWPTTSAAKLMDAIKSGQLKWYNYIEFILGFLTTGRLKRIADYYDELYELGFFKGTWSIIKWSWIYSKIIIPLIFSLITSIVQGFAVLGEWADGMDYSSRVYYLIMDKMESSVFPKDETGEWQVWKTIIPFSWYWSTLYEKWNDVNLGKFNWITERAIEKAEEIKKIAEEKFKKTENDVKKVVDKSKTEIENLKKQVKEKSFEAYLKLNKSRGEVFDGQEGLYYYTKDSEGKPHRYYFSNGTFVEDSE